MSDATTVKATAVTDGVLAEPLLDPVSPTADAEDPEAQLSRPTRTSPSPSSPQGHGDERDLSGMVARVTTSCLVPAANGEYEGTAEAVDEIFKKHILPAAQTKHGYIDSTRLFDGETGDYVLVSYVRFNMFKTEHFRCATVHPRGAKALTVSTFACLNSLTLRDGDDMAAVVPRVDEVFENGLVADAVAQSNFVGAQRFVALETKPDTPKTVMLATYFKSAAGLHASTADSHFKEHLSQLATFSREGVVEATRLYRGEYFELPRVPVISRLFTEGSMRAATFQLACVCLGVGIFAMPNVFAEAGLLTGTIMVIGFGLAADFAIQCMLWGAEASGAETAEDVLGAAFGEAGRKVALLALALTCFMGNSAHVQFIAAQFMLLQGEGGGFVGTIFGDDLKVQQFVTTVIFGLVALPFCFKRSLAELRYVSLAVVFFALFTTIVVVCTCAVEIAHNGTVYNSVATRPGISIVDYSNYLGVAAFGYSMIIEVFAVRAEARERHKLGQAVHAAVAIVVVIMTVVGVVGALAIENPGGNVLTSFPGNRFISVISLGLVLIITLLYPLINFPMAVALDSLFARKGAPPNYGRRRLVSVIGLACIIGMDSLVPNVDDVFSLAGSLGLGLMAFTLPPAAFLGIKAAHASRACGVAVAVVLLILGLTLTLGSTSVTIFGIATRNATVAPAANTSSPSSSSAAVLSLWW